MHLRNRSSSIYLVLLISIFSVNSCKKKSNKNLEHGSSKAKVSYNIANGAQSNGVDKYVFMLTDTNFSKVATGVNVKHPRCILTNAHVIDSGGYDTLAAGRTPEEDVPSSKLQGIQNSQVRPNWGADYTDLAIVWMKNIPIASGRSIIETDYDPRQITDTMGLGNIVVDENGNYPTNVLSTGAPKVIVMHGYGYNENVNGQNQGEAVRRWGSQNITHYFQGSLQINPKAGSRYVGKFVNPDDKNALCSGDSGAPVFQNGGTGPVLAIGQGSSTAICDGNGVSGFIGLDKGAPAGQKSNWDWVNETITKICTKTLSFWTPSGGYIAGTVSPIQEFVDPDWDPNSGSFDYVDNQINCGETSSGQVTRCSEFIHSNQSITVTAYPNSGFVFNRWDENPWATVPLCPCVGQGSVCTINYSNMGYYDETTNEDISECVPVFEAAE